jgi:hypothetical protein
MYADDMGLLSPNPDELQAAFNSVNAWARETSMAINGSKIKVRKFREGEKLARHDFFTCWQDKLETVTRFKCLGITLQTTGASFTRLSGQRLSCNSRD